MTDNCQKIAIAVAAIFVLKVITGIAAPLLIGTPLRASVHAGLGLAQIGEFSFVLAEAGRASTLLSDDVYQVFLSSSVVTMMATPFVLRAAPSLSAWITSRRLLQKASRLRRRAEAEGFPAESRIM